MAAVKEWMMRLQEAENECESLNESDPEIAMNESEEESFVYH